MGLLNTNQVLQGARTLGGDKTYTLGAVRTRPTTAINGTNLDQIDFTGGVIEIEGQNYSMNATNFRFTNLGTLVGTGQTHLLCAVASYAEPASISAAETSGLNYYVDAASNGNESLAYSFLPSTITTAIDAAGGITVLADKVLKGVNTVSEKTVFDAYWQAAEAMRDPRYAVFPIAPTGFSFVLAQVTPQDNSSAKNALFTKSQNDFNLFKSQVPYVYQERLVYTLAAFNSRYTTKSWLIASAKSYTSLANAQNDVTGTTVNLPITFPLATGGVTHVAVYEYTYPSNMPLGQTGKQDAISRYLTRENSSYLGRINPIYLNNDRISVRFANAAASKLTLYGDPVPLVKVTLGASSAITGIVDAYDMLFN